VHTLGRITGTAMIWIVLVGGGARAFAQTPPAPTPPTQPTPPNGQPAPIENTIDAGESDNVAPARRLVSWNEFDGRLFSIRFGGGYLYDYATYSQDANSKQQFPDLEADGKLRDARVLFKGKLKFKRPTTWSAGIMYDAGNDEWVFRQTGIMVEVPEIWGQIFVGRTKEGFSLNKVMIGYAGWAMERAPINDATLPILADGIKWLAYLPKARVLWNLGVYGDALSEGQGFSSYDNQISGRLAWLPILSEDGNNLLHLGVSGRYGKPDGGKLRLKARPGAWPAPFFIDTAEFPANSSRMTGLEVYYRPRSVTIGSEFFIQHVNAPDSGNPVFHGGEVFLSWLITGEVRTYNTRGGYFNLVSPKRPVINGGPGAWEIITHMTYADADSGTLNGGRFWRFTPMVNWYLTDHLRLETAYGYGSLNRFGTVGKTHFFQTRFQFQM
jgi:phosphate-selective porin OprO/OprP